MRLRVIHNHGRDFNHQKRDYLHHSISYAAQNV